MDTMTRSLAVKGDILTLSPPHQGGGGEDKKSISFEEPCDQKKFPHRKVSLQGVGIVRNNKHYNEEPRGKKRFSHREVSSSGGRGRDEKWIL